MPRVYKEEVKSVQIERREGTRAVFVTTRYGVYDEDTKTWTIENFHVETYDIGREGEIADIIAGVQSDLLSAHSDATAAVTAANASRDAEKARADAAVAELAALKATLQPAGPAAAATKR